MRETPEELAERVPPGQALTTKWPVLTYGLTPRFDPRTWTFRCFGLVEQEVCWTWEEFLKLPSQTFTADIHCVTKWSKLDTRWQGVSVDVLLEHVELDPRASFVMAFSYGGYTTNLPLPDLLNGKAFVAYSYNGRPSLAPEHGGPARLVVPHLYFWKSAKWVRGLELIEKDQPGFWESLGYHNRGDPWKEERYQGD
jgi:DMSO/TMAO reductase YedYZ molybdopterin-dependent catalytic subunit